MEEMSSENYQSSFANVSLYEEGSELGIVTGYDIAVGDSYGCVVKLELSKKDDMTKKGELILVDMTMLRGILQGLQPQSARSLLGKTIAFNTKDFVWKSLE